MRGTFSIPVVSGLILIITNSPCFSAEPNDPNRYLKAVRTFADNVLRYGRDTYGPKQTPLFVDGLNIHTHEPVKWIAANGDRWILCNLASQQNLFRTLDGLSRITGDPKYKQAAMNAIRYAFDNLRSPNGLLYWAYDAHGDNVCGGEAHSLKYFYPYYELMWETDPNITKQFIESFWAAHIWDWSNLAMNRVGPYNKLVVPKGWGNAYKGGPVFFDSEGKSFFNTGSDLFYAAAILCKLSGEKEPLTWSKRLARRYIETRNPKTGISGYVYSRWKRDGAQLQFGDDFNGHLVLSGTLFPASPGFRKKRVETTQTIRGWICELALADLLGTDGGEFGRWALEELTAWGKAAFRKVDNSFIPMLMDGTSLEGHVLKKNGDYGPEGMIIRAWPLGPIELWAYSLAYRVSGDEYIWGMVRNIALGNGFGDIGTARKNVPKLDVNTDCSNPYVLLAFLELYRKTGERTFLEIAKRIGDNIVSAKLHRGFFVPSKKHIYARFDDIEHLTLLHLHGAVEADSVAVPRILPSCPFFFGTYRNRQREYDIYLIYPLTESSEVPISLHEAVILGDLERVTSLLSQGADIDGWDASNRIPLHYAAINGHEELVKLLLAKGADANAQGMNGATALCSAVVAAHRNIVEMLVATQEVDINGKDGDGFAPLHYAVSSLQLSWWEGQVGECNSPNDLDITKLLIKHGADVNAKSTDGRRPLDLALSPNRKDIVELLLSNGAEIYSMHVAARVGDIAKVTAFLEAGIDVNVKDNRSFTPLHEAVMGKHKQVATLLIDSGADINARVRSDYTPIYYAIWSGSTEMVEFLIRKGADVNVKDEWDLTRAYASKLSGCRSWSKNDDQPHCSKASTSNLTRLTGPRMAI